MKGGSNNGSGKKRKRWITLSIMSVTLLISIASAVVGYKYVMKTLNDNKLREALEGKDLLNFQNIEDKVCRYRQKNFVLGT